MPAQWEGVFINENVNMQLFAPSYMPLNILDEITDIPIEQLKNAEYNFRVLGRLYKNAHQKLEKLSKKMNDLELHGRKHKKFAELYKANFNLVELQTYIEHGSFTELYNIYEKHKVEIVNKIERKKMENESEIRETQNEITQCKTYISDIEKLMKFSLSEDEIAEFKVTRPAITRLECGICTTREVDHVLGCGHTYCGECVNSLQAKKCPYCNQHFESATRLYFTQ